MDEHESEPKSLETVKMSREEMEKDGEYEIPGNHEGRFGEQWDAEISIPAVVWITVGVAVITAFFFIWGWFLYGGFADDFAKDVQPRSVLAPDAGPSRPPGPLLQAEPEDEFREMRFEYDARMGQLEDEKEREKYGFMAYGWVDESREIVHIPIDKAVEVVLERGLEGVPSISGVSGDSGPSAEDEGTNADEAPVEEASAS